MDSRRSTSEAMQSDWTAGAGRVTENTLADIRSFSRERSIESVLAEGDEDYAVGAADAV